MSKEAASFSEAASAYFEEGSSYFKIAMLSNLSAFIYSEIPDLNWAGFYLFDGEELVLGPFQGETACTRIKIGRGVCGTSAKERRTVIVPDVSLFPGHIACSAKSKSEIVVPIFTKSGDLYGVIDLDSPSLNRFGEKEKEKLEALSSRLSEIL